MQYPQCSWWEPCQNSRSSDPSCPCPSRKPRGMSQGHAQCKDFGMEIPGVGPDHCGYGPVCTSQPRDESPSPPESHKSQISSSTPTAGLQDLCGAQGNLIYPASFVSVTPPGLLNKPMAWNQSIHAPNHQENSWSGFPLPARPSSNISQPEQ